MSKNTRPPIGKQTTVNQMTDAEKTRLATGPQRLIDTRHYEIMPEYAEMQLFGALSNEVDHWLALGAAPVPRVSKSSVIYPGINDRMDSEYQIYPSVSVIDGHPIDMFLLFMPKEDYKRYKIDPINQRNEEILKSMGMGKADKDSITMTNVKGLKTYAPNVGDGQTGINIRHGELFHDV